jgi:hypothetical protein
MMLNDAKPRMVNAKAKFAMPPDFAGLLGKGTVCRRRDSN